MSDPIIFVLIGPPGAGKSTWRDRYLNEATRPTIVVSNDDVVEEFAAEHGLNYTEAFAQIDQKEVKQKVNERFDRAVRDGADIILDRTNLTTKGRRSFLQRVPKSYTRLAILFDIPRETLDQRLFERAERTGKRIPKRVVDDMLASYEVPAPGEFHNVASGTQV